MTRPLDSQASYNDRRFRDLDLAGLTVLGSEFHDCRFDSCSFVESRLQECRFVDCHFQECDLSLLQVLNTVFSAVRFLNCRIIGVDWTQADWSAIPFGQPIGFQRCAISHSTFIGLSLPGLQIIECLAADVDFREADLARADFSHSDLNESLFLNTNLSQADLRSARNYHIAPQHNQLKGARFTLPEAMSLLYNLDINLSEGPE